MVPRRFYNMARDLNLAEVYDRSIFYLSCVMRNFVSMLIPRSGPGETCVCFLE